MCFCVPVCLCRCVWAPHCLTQVQGTELQSSQEQQVLLIAIIRIFFLREKRSWYVQAHIWGDEVPEGFSEMTVGACRMAMSSQAARRVIGRNGYFSKEGIAPSPGSSLGGQGRAGYLEGKCSEGSGECGTQALNLG